MKKLLKYFMFIFAAVAIAACGGDDNDEPEDPSNPSSSIDLSVKSITIPYDGIRELDCPEQISLGFDTQRYHSESRIYVTAKYVTAHMVYIGPGADITSIKTVPSEGWYYASYDPQEGKYAIEYYNGGKAYYIRLLIESFNYDASGNKIGLNAKYQLFTPEN